MQHDLIYARQFPPIPACGQPGRSLLRPLPSAVLGGGLPLGSLLLVVEDGCTEHHVSIARCFLAEGIHHGHSALLCGPDAPPLPPAASGAAARDALMAWLPSIRRSRAAAAAAAGTASAPSHDVDIEELASGAAQGGDLRIAWQYRRYTEGLPAGPDGRPGSGAMGERRAGTAAVPGAGRPRCPAPATADGAQGPAGAVSASVPSRGQASSAAGTGHRARVEGQGAKTPEAALRAGASKRRCEDWDLGGRMGTGDAERAPAGQAVCVVRGCGPCGLGGADLSGGEGGGAAGAVRAACMRILEGCAPRSEVPGGRGGGVGTAGGALGTGGGAARSAGGAAIGAVSGTAIRAASGARALHPLVAKRLAARAAEQAGEASLTSHALSIQPPV